MGGKQRGRKLRNERERNKRKTITDKKNDLKLKETYAKIIKLNKKVLLRENARGISPVPYPFNDMSCLGWGWDYPVLVLAKGGQGGGTLSWSWAGGMGWGRAGRYPIFVLTRADGVGGTLSWSWWGYPLPSPPPNELTNKVKTLPSLVLHTWAVKINKRRNNR